MLIAASWPSNKLAAETILTLLVGLYGFAASIFSICLCKSNPNKMGYGATFSLVKISNYRTFTLFLSFFTRNPLFCGLELMPHFTLDISITCMRIRLFLLGMGLFFASITQAQMTGVVVEVDTAFYGPNTPTPDDTFDPDGNLDGFVTYKVYAEFIILMMYLVPFTQM